MAPTTPVKQDSQSETTSSRTLPGDNNESDSSRPQNPGAVAATTNNGGQNQPQADHPDVPEDEDEQMQDIVRPSSPTEDSTPRKSVAPPQSGDKKKFSKSSAVFSQHSSRYESPSPPSAQVPRHQQQHSSSSSHAVNTHDTIAASDRGDDDPDSRRSDGANSTSTVAMQEEAPQPVAPPVTGEEGEAGDEEGPMDWDDLERRFEAEMEACRENERKLREEWDRWVEIFHEWSSAGARRDEDRARKRLKTRIAHVKISEEKLAEQKAHYNKVLTAFQSALALLNGDDAEDDSDAD